MQMMKIDSLKTLKQEKKRLRQEIAENEKLLKEDFAWIIEEMKPSNIIGNSLGQLITTRKNGILGDSISSGLGYLIKKTVLGRSSWIIKLIVPHLIKNLSSNLIGE